MAAAIRGVRPFESRRSTHHPRSSSWITAARSRYMTAVMTSLNRNAAPGASGAAVSGIASPLPGLDCRGAVGAGTGCSSAPIPVAGLLTLLFIIERVWVGDPPKTSLMYSDEASDLE